MKPSDHPYPSDTARAGVATRLRRTYLDQIRSRDVWIHVADEAYRLLVTEPEPEYQYRLLSERNTALLATSDRPLADYRLAQEYHERILGYKNTKLQRSPKPRALPARVWEDID